MLYDLGTGNDKVKGHDQQHIFNDLDHDYQYNEDDDYLIKGQSKPARVNPVNTNNSSQ